MMSHNSTEYTQTRGQQDMVSGADRAKQAVRHHDAFQGINGPVEREQEAQTKSVNRPLIYAGIDEAGLGPLLGPFTVGLVKFRLLEGGNIFANPDGLILGAIATIAELNPSRGSTRLLIRDSKVLFSQAGSMRRLEDAALAFAAASQPPCTLPVDTTAFLHAFWQTTEALDDYPWYRELEKTLRLPVQSNPNRVISLGREIVRCLAEKNITVETVRTTIVPVRSFNRTLARSTNKATATFSVIRTLIEESWRMSPPDVDILVRIDKQGGRDNYLPVLDGCIEGARFMPVVEGGEESRYLVEQGDRRMVIHFALRSDAAYLPVMLAGIMAKYTRELLMNRQNEWFSAREPSLPPTAGYPLDARRWLKDSLAVRKRLGIDDALVIRNR